MEKSDGLELESPCKRLWDCLGEARVKRNMAECNGYIRVKSGENSNMVGEIERNKIEIVKLREEGKQSSYFIAGNTRKLLREPVVAMASTGKKIHLVQR